jgi:hypothetical protein
MRWQRILEACGGKVMMARTASRNYNGGSYSVGRLFCAAVTLFDMLINTLQRERERFKRILDWIKAIWNNIFSHLAESFSEGSLAGDNPDE